MAEDNETEPHYGGEKRRLSLLPPFMRIKLNCSEKLELKFISVYSNLNALNRTFYVEL